MPRLFLYARHYNPSIIPPPAEPQKIEAAKDAHNSFSVTAVEFPDTGEKVPCYFLTENRNPCCNCQPVLGFSGYTAAGVGQKAA